MMEESTADSEAVVGGTLKDLVDFYQKNVGKSVPPGEEAATPQSTAVLADSAMEHARVAKENVVEAAHGAKETVDHAFGSAADSASEASGSVKKSMVGIGHAVKDSTEDKVESATDFTNDFTGSVKKAFGDLAHSAHETAEYAFDSVKQTLESTGESVKKSDVTGDIGEAMDTVVVGPGVRHSSSGGSSGDQDLDRDFVQVENVVSVEGGVSSKGAKVDHEEKTTESSEPAAPEEAGGLGGFLHSLKDKAEDWIEDLTGTDDPSQTKTPDTLSKSERELKKRGSSQEEEEEDEDGDPNLGHSKKTKLNILSAGGDKTQSDAIPPADEIYGDSKKDEPPPATLKDGDHKDNLDRDLPTGIHKINDDNNNNDDKPLKIDGSPLIHPSDDGDKDKLKDLKTDDDGKTKDLKEGIDDSPMGKFKEVFPVDPVKPHRDASPSHDKKKEEEKIPGWDDIPPEYFNFSKDVHDEGQKIMRDSPMPAGPGGDKKHKDVLPGSAGEEPMELATAFLTYDRDPSKAGAGKHPGDGSKSSDGKESHDGKMIDDSKTSDRKDTLPGPAGEKPMKLKSAFLTYDQDGNPLDSGHPHHDSGHSPIVPVQAQRYYAGAPDDDATGGLYAHGSNLSSVKRGSEEEEEEEEEEEISVEHHHHQPYTSAPMEHRDTVIAPYNAESGGSLASELLSSSERPLEITALDGKINPGVLFNEPHPVSTDHKPAHPFPTMDDEDAERSSGGHRPGVSFAPPPSADEYADRLVPYGVPEDERYDDDDDNDDYGQGTYESKVGLIDHLRSSTGTDDYDPASPPCIEEPRPPTPPKPREDSDEFDEGDDPEEHPPVLELRAPSRPKLSVTFPGGVLIHREIYNWRNMDPNILDLVYWKDPQKTGIIFGVVLAFLLLLQLFPLVQFLAYLALLVLMTTFSYRIYCTVLAAIKKNPDTNPYSQQLAKPVVLPNEKIHDHANIIMRHLADLVHQLKRLFFVENYPDSLKLGALLWLGTIFGKWFSGLSLLMLFVIAIFTLPKIYQTHQTEIDKHVKVAREKYTMAYGQIEEKLPAFMKPVKKD